MLDSVKRMGPQLPPRLWALLSGLFVMNLSFFMMAPFLAVYIANTLALGGVAAGIVLMTTAISQKGLMFFAGILADRFGHRRAMLSGLLLRVAGFTCYAFAGSLPVLIVAAAVSGIGGALFTPAVRSAIATLAPPEKRIVAFSVRNVLNNAGAAIGPMLGAYLVKLDMRAVFLASAAVYLFLFLIFLFFLKNIITLHSTGANVGQLIASIVSNRRFLSLIALNIGIWFLYSQLTVSLPLKAALMVEEVGQVGRLLAVNGLTILILQYPVTFFVTNRVRPLTGITAGVFFITAGLASVAFADSFRWLLLSVFVFSLGEMLVLPAMDTVIADWARQDNIGTFYGFSMLASGIGGALGQYTGGWLSDFSARSGAPALPWAIFGVVGSVVTLAFLRFTFHNLKSDAKSAV